MSSYYKKMSHILTTIALKSIKAYQYYISPYKGFSCAHRVATNEISCSAYGAKVIQRFGFFTGYQLLKRRFHDCNWHAKNLNYQISQSSNSGRNLLSPYQRGFIDCDCPDLDILDCCDIPDCGGKNKENHSDNFIKKREKKNKKKYNKTGVFSNEVKSVDLSKKD